MDDHAIQKRKLKLKTAREDAVRTKLLGIAATGLDANGDKLEGQLCIRTVVTWLAEEGQTFQTTGEAYRDPLEVFIDGESISSAVFRGESLDITGLVKFDVEPLPEQDVFQVKMGIDGAEKVLLPDSIITHLFYSTFNPDEMIEEPSIVVGDEEE